MKLISLLEKLEYTCLQGSTDQEVKNVIYDSRKVEEGSLFICIRGAVVDGHKFVPDVVAKGAKVLIVEEAVEAPEDVTVILVKDTRYAMAFISAAYFGYPAEKLKTIGITGTKGKTTTTYMVKSILENAGYKVGLIGTIEAIIGDKVIPAKNTTPESYVIQEYFHEMAEAGCDCVVMEVSSQGLMLHRTQGFVFDFGIFTNIEPDHIGPNEHKDFDDYLRCKSLLLKQCKVGIVNRDDEHFEKIIEGHTCSLETYGFSPEADLRAEDAKLVGGKGYLGISYHLKGLLDFHVEIDIPGKFSIYNSLTAIAICRHFKVSEENILKALKGLGDFQVNPNMLEYGSRIAEITDFRVIDDKGRCSNTVEKGSCFKIRMKVRFNEEIQEPIMAYTFKNIQGTEITGTNTMYENAKIEHSGKGDICTVTFTQNMNLQGGEYLLSFGCTGYKNGDFTVFHRLYDACNITVISSKNTVGFYDMDSKVEVRCEEQV